MTKSLWGKGDLPTSGNGVFICISSSMGYINPQCDYIQSKEVIKVK